MSNFDKIVAAGKSFACSVYRTQPGALIPNPLSDILKLAWDSLCADDSSGLPPPPQPPFQGGQCVGVQYLLVYKGINSEGNEYTSSPRLLFGPLFAENIYGVSTVPGSFTQQFVLYSYTSTGQPLRDVVVSQVYDNTSPMTPYSYVFSLERIDGQPDNCGNLPPAYPSTTPPPDDGYDSAPTNITYNDGTDFTVVFNLKPPTDGSSSPPDICLTVGIKLVEFEVCFPFDALPRLGGGGDGGEIEELIRELQADVLSLQDRVNELLDPPDPESDPTLSPVVMPGEGGGVEEGLPGLKWVVVQLTTLPVKAQFGTPTVNFAGWITFMVDGKYVNRQPLEFERGLFRAPPDANGYGITFTNKAEGVSTAYVEQTNA